LGEPSVCTPTCGDNVIIGKETCDDGNILATDGCGANCTIETGWNCTGVPSVCEELPENKAGGKGGAIAAGIIVTLLLVAVIVVAVILIRKRRPELIDRLSRKFPSGNKAVNLQADESGKSRNNTDHSRAEAEDVPMERTETSRSESSFKQAPPPKPTQVQAQKPALMSSMDEASDYRNPPKQSPKPARVPHTSQYPTNADYTSKGATRYSPTVVFGVPLDQVKKINNVPNVLEETIQYLEQKGLDEEGILRLAGGANEIKQLKSVYDSGQTPDFAKCSDIQSVAGVMKLYLRELPRPLLLITSGLKTIIDSDESASLSGSLIEELNNIPEVNYYTMKRLFGFLHQVTLHSGKNKMTSSNLAIVFHPTLQISMELLEIMISQYPKVFVY